MCRRGGLVRTALLLVHCTLALTEQDGVPVVPAAPPSPAVSAAPPPAIPAAPPPPPRLPPPTAPPPPAAVCGALELRHVCNCTANQQVFLSAFEPVVVRLFLEPVQSEFDHQRSFHRNDQGYGMFITKAIISCIGPSCLCPDMRKGCLVGQWAQSLAARVLLVCCSTRQVQQ
jgi:hypothetical protein